MNEIELYTCTSGLSLFENGRNFSAWEKDSESYRSLENIGNTNIKITVNKAHIKDSVRYENEYDIIDIESVEIVGEW